MKRSKRLALRTTVTLWNDGHNCAAWAISPHTPQPTQVVSMAATGAVLSVFGDSSSVSDGQPLTRMQE
jgi:hypothetical protein